MGELDAESMLVDRVSSRLTPRLADYMAEQRRAAGGDVWTWRSGFHQFPGDEIQSVEQWIQEGKNGVK